MSSAVLGFASTKVCDISLDVSRVAQSPLQRAFAAHLDKVATALYALEQVLSLGAEPGSEIEAVSGVLGQFTAGDMADQGAKQFREGEAAGTALDQLARQIAENTVRSDIESYAEWVEVDGLRFMDTTRAQDGSGDPVKALEYVRFAVEYIDQRGDAFDWHMQRHISAPHLVRFVEKSEVSA